MTKRVLWFSRHEMSEPQKDALGDKVQITQVNVQNLQNVWQDVNVEIDGQIKTVKLSEFAPQFDIIAIVAPLNLQKQFLDISGGKPVIFAQNVRTLIPNPDGGEDKVVFKFGGWKQIKKIDVVMEDFA